ncbi:MAG: hypothetical protein HXX11_20120 [Desulfuromonadales bacterium]|nr:hypothetical protein [Desulfuromonadales bacterium]
MRHMKWIPLNPKICLYLASFIVFATGLAISISVYQAAQIMPDSFPEFEFEETKKYMRDLELYGGKMNVLSVEFMKWFNGLWHGKSLAYTVGFITILVASGFALAAYYISSEVESENWDEH